MSLPHSSRRQRPQSWLPADDVKQTRSGGWPLFGGHIQKAKCAFMVLQICCVIPGGVTSPIFPTELTKKATFCPLPKCVLLSHNWVMCTGIRPRGLGEAPCGASGSGWGRGGTKGGHPIDSKNPGEETHAVEFHGLRR